MCVWCHLPIFGYFWHLCWLHFIWKNSWQHCLCDISSSCWASCITWPSTLLWAFFVWGFQRAILRRHKDGKRRCCVQRFWQRTSRVERRPDGPDSTDKIKKLLWNIKISPDAGISSQLLTLTCAKQLSPSWALICLEHWIHCRSPYEAFQVSFIRRSCTDTRVCSARRGLKSLLE